MTFKFQERMHVTIDINLSLSVQLLNLYLDKVVCDNHRIDCMVIKCITFDFIYVKFQIRSSSIVTCKIMRAITMYLIFLAKFWVWKPWLIHYHIRSPRLTIVCNRSNRRSQNHSFYRGSFRTWPKYIKCALNRRIDQFCLRWYIESSFVSFCIQNSFNDVYEACHTNIFINELIL